MRSFSNATQMSRCALRGNCRTQPVAYFSGLCSLIIFLSLSSIPAYAEWVAVEKDYLLPGLQTLYVDPESICREGNPRGPHRFLSTKTHKQFDCAGKRVRLLAFTEFSRGMGTGMPRDGYVDKDNWLPVEAESMSHALWEAACGKE